MSTALQRRLAILEFAKVAPASQQSCESILRLVNRESYDSAERIWLELRQSGEHSWDEHAKGAADDVTQLFEAARDLLSEGSDPSESGPRSKHTKKALYLILGGCIVALISFSIFVIASGFASWKAAMFAAVVIVLVLGLFQVRELDDQQASSLLLRMIISAVLIAALAAIG